MCRTPHWGAVPEPSERGRSVSDGSRTLAAPLLAYGTDSGEAAGSAPEVPLPPSPAAIILEVAPRADPDPDSHPDRHEYGRRAAGGGRPRGHARAEPGRPPPRGGARTAVRGARAGRA